MKGIIFNLVEEVVRGTYGEDVWESLLDAAGLHGSYTSLGSYPDEELFQLVSAASEAFEIPPNDVIRILGERAIPLLAERFPQFFEQPATLPFLLTLNEIIHPEVRKLYPDADVPVFEFERVEANELLIGYRSPRKLCALADGFIRGAATHFGETVDVEQPVCMHAGDEQCVLRCRFNRLFDGSGP